MPEIPDIPLPSLREPGLPVPAPPPVPGRVAFGGGAPAQAVTRGLQTLIGEVSKVAEVERQRAEDDVFRAKRRQLFDQWEMPNIHDERTGLNNRRGRNAMGADQELQGSYDKFGGELLKDVKSPQLRSRIKDLIDGRRAYVFTTIERHVAVEREAFRQQEIEATMDAADRRASQDPSTATIELANKQKALLDRADDLGTPGNVVNEQLVQSRTQLHAAVISTMISKDQDQAAVEYFNSLDTSDLDQKAVAILRENLERATLKGNSQRITDFLLVEFGEDEAAMKRAITSGSIEIEGEMVNLTPELRDAVRDRVDRRLVEQRRILSRLRLKNFRGYRAVLLDPAVSGDLNQLPQNWEQTVDHEHQLAIEKISADMLKGTPKHTSMRHWSKWESLSPETRATLEEGDLWAKFQPYLSEKDFKGVLSDWNAARVTFDKQQGDRVKASKFLNDKESIKDAMLRFGIIPPGKRMSELTEDQQAAANVYQFRANAIIQERRIAPDGKVREIPFKERREILTDLAFEMKQIPIFIDDFGLDTERTALTILVNERQQAYVPASIVRKFPDLWNKLANKVVATMQDQQIQPTNSEIEKRVSRLAAALILGDVFLGSTILKGE